MKASQRIAKNAAWGILAGVVGGGVQFLSVIVVARTLPVSSFGTYNYLLAFAILFQFLADFGLVNILVREMARRPGELKRLLGSAKGLMWVLFFIFLVLLAIAALVQNVPGEVKALSFVMGVASLTLLQGVSYAAVLRAFEDMEFNSIGFTLHKAALLGFIVITLKLGFGLWGLVFAHLAANLLLWFYYAQVVGWRFRLWVSLQKDLPLWKALVGEAIPLGGGLLLRQIGWQLDSLMLFWLADAYSAGLFGGPYRILLAVRLISMILVLPLYPALVRMAKDSLSEFWVAYDRALKWLFCLSVPGAVIFLCTPEPVVRTILGAKFLASTDALQWFGLAFVPLFVSALFPYVFTALGRQHFFFLIIGIALIVRVGLEVWLIPKFGYMSACVIASWCEILPFSAFVVFLGWGRLLARLPDIFIRPICAGLAMGGVLIACRTVVDSQEQLPLKILVYLAAGAVYAGVLLLVKTFSKAELGLAKEALSFVGPYLRSFRQKPETPSGS
jgi:O-antigen/teichoic acid export membrane protein